jgi:hypothetical protein
VLEEVCKTPNLYINANVSIWWNWQRGPNKIYWANVFTKCYWDYGPFRGTFVKKPFFHKEEFSNEILQLVIYFIYSCHSMSHIFWKSNLSRYEFLKVHKFYQILCFILKNEHNFKLYYNILKCSILFFCVINYNFPLNNIYIASHLHVVKDSWTLNKP